MCSVAIVFFEALDSDSEPHGPSEPPAKQVKQCGALYSYKENTQV